MGYGDSDFYPAIWSLLDMWKKYCLDSVVIETNNQYACHSTISYLYRFSIISSLISSDMIYPQARFHNHVSNFQGILIWIRHHDQFQISDISFGISSIPLILMDPFFQSIWCHGATITLRSSFMQALSIYCLSLRISPVKNLGIQPARKNGRTKTTTKMEGFHQESTMVQHD